MSENLIASSSWTFELVYLYSESHHWTSRMSLRHQLLQVLSYCAGNCYWWQVVVAEKHLDCYSTKCSLGSDFGQAVKGQIWLMHLTIVLVNHWHELDWYQFGELHLQLPHLITAFGVRPHFAFLAFNLRLHLPLLFLHFLLLFFNFTLSSLNFQFIIDFFLFNLFLPQHLCL